MDKARTDNPALPRSEQPDAGKGLTRRIMQACRGRRALPALGLLSFLESSLLPVPIDLAMIPIVLARAHALWRIVLAGTLGSVAGAVAGYLIGAFFMQALGGPLLSAYGGAGAFDEFRDLYAENGWIAVLVAGITPIPFKVAAILSGAAAMRFDLFLLAAVGVRLLRFSLIAGAIRLFGSGLQTLIDRRGWSLAFLLCLVTIGGFLMVPAIL